MSVQVKGSGTIGGIDEGLVVSGIVTATELDISGNIDVDGHTELDNINISGVSTHVGLSQFQNTINLTHASAGQNYIYFNEDLQFAKNGTGTRLKIDTSGRLLLGTTDIGYASFADNLTIADSANCGITLRSGTSNQGNIYFSDGTGTSADTYRGYITYAHADNDMLFATNSVERLRIDSSGRIGVGVVPTAQFAHNLIQIGHQATLGANAALSTTGQTFLTHNLYFDTGGTLKVFNTSNANEGAIFRLVDGQLLFSNSTATTGTPTVVERLRIDSSGHLLLGTTTGGLTDYGDSLTIADANAGMTLRVAATNQASHIYFADGTSGDAQYRGYVQYHHNTDEMKFGTAATERVRISSGGQLQISPAGAVKMSFYHDSGGSLNHITSNNGNEIKVSSGNGDSNGIEFWDYTGTNKRCQIDGHGIKFNTDTAEANALDDYEEGTYVPSTNTGLTLNSGYNTFSYIKIGRVCTVRGLFFPNNNPSGGHNMTITLPFASYNHTGSGASLAGAGGSGVMYRSISGADAGVAVYVNDNSSTATFYKNGSNGGAWSPVYNNDWNNGMEIYIDVTYFTV